ncbi:MAG: DHH family phosphoesterase, partial [Candidatus Aureabacteria bacterium]|nr:DHH family phosphoesterase [Candidatus Auribacterota bacterium]
MKQARNELRTELLEKIRQAVNAHDRFAVFSHEEPDGDAIGSQIALTLALRSLGKEVLAVRLDGVPDSLAFLNRDRAIERYDEARDRARIREVQVVVVVDACGYHRLGALAGLARGTGARTINIDHHRDNQFFGDVNFVRFQAGGAAELVSEVIRAIGVPLTGAIAEAIYVG